MTDSDLSLPALPLLSSCRFGDGLEPVVHQIGRFGPGADIDRRAQPLPAR